MDVSHIFGASDTIAYGDLNENFADITAALSQLHSSNLAPDAGILSTQLAQRYTLSEYVIPLVPVDAGSAIVAAGAAGTPFAVPTTTADILKKRHTLKSGQEAWICEVEAYVAYRATVSANDVVFEVKKGATTLGGAAVTFDTSDQYYRVRNTNPLDNPLISLQDADELAFRLGASAAGGPPTARGVMVRVVVKTELMS